MSKIGKSVLKDLTGKKFGRLTVLERAEDYIQPNGKHKTQWLCKCDCGNENKIAVVSYQLTRGITKSCGCLRYESKEKIGNKYDLFNDYGIGYTSNTNEPFYFDLEDYNKIKDYTWWNDGHGYIVSSNGKNKTIRMHRVVMLKESDYYNLNILIDHKNGEKSRNDNRKSNLRIATYQENSRNRSYTKLSSSGFIGVSFRKDRNKWRAYINEEYGKQISLGLYETFTEAVYARLIAEQKYFGEFAYKEHEKVLNYINDGGILEPYNRNQIENIMYT